MNAEINLKAKALRYLVRREYTRAELASKLSALTEDSAEVETVLNDFERKGWLSESRALEQLIQKRGRKYGKARIEYEARAKGIDENLVAEAMPRVGENEFDSAYQIWHRKFGQLPVDLKDRAKQIRFMQSRGFSLEICKQVLSLVDEERGI